MFALWSKIYKWKNYSDGRFLEEKARKMGKKLYICERNNNEYMKSFKERRQNNWYDCSREMLKLHAEALKSDFKTNNIEERPTDGQIVVSDRQKFTTMTLFGALGVPRHILYEAVYDLPDPGRTIYLDVNPVISVMRSIKTESDKPLKTDLKFQEKVRALYLQYAKDHKFEIIKPNQTQERVFEIIESKVLGGIMKKYVFALIKNEEKILMLKRPKDKKVYAGYWNFPGGKIEESETEIQCVIREVKEETGMDFEPSVKIMDIVDKNIEPKKVVVFDGNANGSVKLSEEHEEYGWFTIEEIKNIPVLPYIKKIFEEA